MGDPRPEAAAAGFRPPLLANRYVVHMRLGRGATSGVYLVYDLQLCTWRAAKVMHPQASKDEELRRRFAREAVIMAQLDHPNIVRVVDIATEVALPFIVMELLEGGMVYRYVKRNGAMHPALVVQVGIDLCNGLGAVHALDAVHRDVKPQNLLLDRQGRARLTDFGIARLGPARASEKNAASHETETGTVMGTPAFMAPEQRVDTSKVDARADVYSAGATLFTLCTGTTCLDLAQMDASDERFANIPDALRDIVLKACSARVRDRFADGSKMAAALVALRLPDPPEGTPALVGKVGVLPKQPALRLGAAEVQGLTELISAGAIEATYNPDGESSGEGSFEGDLYDDVTDVTESMSIKTDGPSEVPDPPARADLLPPAPSIQPAPQVQRAPPPDLATVRRGAFGAASASAFLVVAGVVLLLTVAASGAGLFAAARSGAEAVHLADRAVEARNKQLFDVISVNQSIVSELVVLGADREPLEASMIAFIDAPGAPEADRYLASLSSAYRSITVGGVATPSSMTAATMTELTAAWDESRNTRAAREAVHRSWMASLAVAVGLADEAD